MKDTAFGDTCLGQGVGWASIILAILLGFGGCCKLTGCNPEINKEGQIINTPKAK